MDWSLLGCGTKGHFTYAPDDRALAERLSLEGAGGTAWRCLRCGAFVPGAPAVTGPVAGVPHIRRGKELRSALILRLFAVERFIRAVLAAVIAVALWRFSYARTSIEETFDREMPALRAVLRVGAIIVNLALVAYLVLTKRLFGVRGGKKAYEARLRSESILQAEIKKAVRTPAGAQHPSAAPATGTDGPPAPAGAQQAVAQHPAAPAPGQEGRRAPAGDGGD